MPIYPGRRKGTHRVTVYAHGKQNEWIVEGTKAEARKFEAQQRTALSAKPVAKTRAGLTFSEFAVNEYEPHARATLKDSTWRKTRRYQVADLVSFFGTSKLDALSEKLVDEYKAECVDRGCRPGYTNALLVALKAMLRWGREQRHLPIPDIRIKRLRVTERRVRAWSLEEVRRLYVASPAWFASMLHFLFDTGCRKGECIAAQWSWVDLDAKLMRIPATEEWHPKDKASREVPLSDALFASLRDRPRTGKYVFLNQYGVPYAYFPHDVFWKARDEAGLEGGIHTTRHTFASHFLSAQPDMPLLAEVMGHSTTYVTELYTHLLPEHLGRARNAVQLAPPSEEWAKPLRAKLGRR